MSSFVYTERNPLERMQQSFLTLPKEVERFYVAFSGGLDSHVLLHATRQLLSQKAITAVHINHGLQQEAAYWEQHCQTACNALEIPLVIHSVKEAINEYRKQGHSLEDAARKARYTVFSDLLGNTECLLTGHHLEDQAETLLLQLMRGAGVKGLGGMRLRSLLGSTYHLRPLLYWTYEERLSYAKQHQLKWIEDPSNQDQTFRRNFMRHTLIPTFKQHWPHATQTLSRAAAYCRETSDLCLEVASEDLKTCKIQSHILSIPALLGISSLRRRNVLRYWLHQRMGKYPSAVQFENIEKLLYVGSQEGTLLACESGTVKRYRDRLYFLEKDTAEQNDHETILWSVDKPLTLPKGDVLKANLREGQGIRASLFEKIPKVEVRFREGGERFHPKSRIGSHPLKKLFQEWGIPPWKRYQWPLIYYNDQLVAIPGYAISKEVAAAPKELGLWISITHSTTIAF